MEQIIITAPSSAVGSQFIQYISGRYTILTVGRGESDILFDFAKDPAPILPQGAAAIVHFAGAFAESSDEEVIQMISANVTGMVKLCAAANKSGIRQIVYISSCSATLPPDSPYFNYYALTKRQAEDAARLYCRKNHIQLCILRPSQLWGMSGVYARHQPLLYTMMRNAARNMPITIYGTHDALRNYVFAENLFRIIEHAIVLHSDETIDVIDKRNYRLSEIAQTIIRAFSSSSTVEFLREKPDIPDNAFLLDTDYFEKWNISFIGFSEGIERAVHSMRAHGEI